MDEQGNLSTKLFKDDQYLEKTKQWNNMDRPIISIVKTAKSEEAHDHGSP